MPGRRAQASTTCTSRGRPRRCSRTRCAVRPRAAHVAVPAQPCCRRDRVAPQRHLCPRAPCAGRRLVRRARADVQQPTRRHHPLLRARRAVGRRSGRHRRRLLPLPSPSAAPPSLARGRRRPAPAAARGLSSRHRWRPRTSAAGRPGIARPLPQKHQKHYKTNRSSMIYSTALLKIIFCVKNEKTL